MNRELEPELVGEGVEAAPAPEEKFDFFTRVPDISFQTAKVPPPGWLYVGPDDQLLLEVFSSISSAIIYLGLRLLLPHGEISPNQYEFRPTGDRAGNWYFIHLPESFLISVTLTAAAEVPAGSCWVRCMLVHGGGGGLSWPQGIAAGYLAKYGVLSWPYPRYQNPVEGPGYPRVIVGTDPAPGVEIAETVPTGARWRPLAVWATLVTSATVADRYVRLALDDAVNTWWESAPITAQPASAAYCYTWAVGVDGRSSPLAGRIQDSLPDRVTLFRSWRVRTSTSNLQAGDNWGAPVLYAEEWLEP